MEQQVYRVTMEDLETICNPNTIVACWYDDDADGFPGVVVDEHSSQFLSDRPIVTVQIRNDLPE